MPSRKKPRTSKASARGDKPATTRKPSGSKLLEYRRKRDFSLTDEPQGGTIPAMPALAFVVQRHAATRLHHDFRLELDGVMKSWAVPKGPSLDPAVKRLAMEVEDHPIEYNTFEGTIPKGQYGGGTVMLWDRGVYTYGGDDAEPLEGLRRGYRKGDFKIVLLGERLKGSWVLVRTRRGKSNKAEWLLIKHRDPYAEPGSDVVSQYNTSVVTGRTMEEIASGHSRVWNSIRAEGISPGLVEKPVSRNTVKTKGSAKSLATGKTKGRKTG
jgi:bifunctional non-homologous end joining protein LigD